MSQKIHIIVLPEEYTRGSITELSAEVTKFEHSDSTHVGIDLSKLTILRSEQIGCLARAIKTTDKRGGVTVILVGSDELVKLLKAIHFDKKARIFEDAEEFKRELANLENSEIRQPSENQTKTSAGKKETPTEVSEEKSFIEYVTSVMSKRRFQFTVLVVALGSIALNAFLAVVLFLQFSSVQKLKATQAEQSVLMQQKLDSIVRTLHTQQEEQRIMQELEQDTGGKTSPKEVVK
jgi:anti-anti-sigma regulatory factor